MSPEVSGTIQGFHHSARWLLLVILMSQ